MRCDIGLYSIKNDRAIEANTSRVHKIHQAHMHDVDMLAMFLLSLQSDMLTTIVLYVNLNIIVAYNYSAKTRLMGLKSKK
jgi:hypothetical protein